MHFLFSVANNQIDWDSIIKYQKIEYVMAKEPITVRSVNCLIKPSYRDSDIYIITQVDRRFTVKSRFPNKKYSSYVEYYYRRHNMQIKKMDQPLFQVEPIRPEKINYIKPRYVGYRDIL